MNALTTCPICHGYGGRHNRRSRHYYERCPACHGDGEMIDEAADKIKAKERTWISCGHCGRLGWCVKLDGKGGELDDWVCAECYAKSRHPEVLAAKAQVLEAEMEEVPF